ncbi:molybdenum cofactor guanylyltransferase MobA [Vibrio sp. TH_r3]|uniref:molybdenum cofactor guanylyltransferase MobA n=1 Tax=Vibrio sp. TH_r3 TaxID=3082084 RepID=UPI0029535292|nr:molybdenum cofactor guanylyltransferase MobA [Vibrio sp. TH_r3]MDV7104337.1 molybdenum cofactor guanylyltransferase MobA [Vibrio sp. TH_r3]
MTNNKLSWVILAGGQASRMGGCDKGLLLLNDQSLVKLIYDKLTPQVTEIAINANRNQCEYNKITDVYNDKISGFQGPLAGIHASLLRNTSQWVGFTPCDAPNIPTTLVSRLSANLDNNIDIYVAHDGTYPQPVFSVWNRNMLNKLERFLNQGDRKMKLLFEQCNVHYVDFSDIPETFVNLNTPEQLDTYNTIPSFAHTTKIGNISDEQA